MSENKTLDFREFRARIGELRGREYWRSLEELSRSDDFDAFMSQEFPQQATPLAKGFDRRNFMKLMGSSIALAGLAACKQPAESIVPYVRQPENLIPGKPLFFASAMPLSGYATGVLVESHMGRPTKIEGNPDHPSSLGASDPFMQASILGLYDPDRSQVVRRTGEISTWGEFVAALQPVITGAKTNGAGLRILTQTVTSPTLGAQLQAVLAAYPGAKWHQWEAVSRDNVREGARLAFGAPAETVYDFTKANVVVSFGSNFCGDGPGHLRYVRDFMSRRKIRQGQPHAMNRLYAIESSFTTTGSVADHRLPIKPSQMEGIAREILAGASSNPFVASLIKDLQANRGASIVIAGDEQPPVIHAIAHAINTAMGNIGATVQITDPAEVAPVNQLESLRQLVTDMNAGAVKALIILGGNPVFDAPIDFNFRSALNKVPFRAHLSPYYDETSMLVHWHIPEVHYLESWSDARAHDGTVSIIQPLIAPLYNGRSAHEVAGALLGMETTPYDAVRNYWRARAGEGAGATPSPSAAPVLSVAPAPSPASFDQQWRKWLHDGLIAGSALPPRAAAASLAVPATTNQQPATGIEIELRHDPTIYDGRFANNGWLQELPKPQTKITWDNVMLLSPKTAERLRVRPSEALINEKHSILANVAYRGANLQLPVWIVPGQADDVATIFYGYGREYGGKIANGTGYNTYGIRVSDAIHGGAGAQITNANKPPVKVACTQEHQSLDPKLVGERGIIRSASLAEYHKDPHFARDHHTTEAGEGAEHHMPNDGNIHGLWVYNQYAWAMVIDTSVCTGCNGCVIACQAENNIPIVGKEEVVREREMHWLRVDRYYRGNPENPEVYNAPIPCMQCENAPCEPVCPVEATSHSQDGLNDMTYNRCVGTRYCSNNCPYKVRRFNFFHYADYDTPALKPMRNPDVTIRTRGVMEKCTYCVQRINEAKITAEKEDRLVRDGEVTTACAQACPTDAIVFGNMLDPASRVAKLKAEPTNYGMLQELNTRPRTTYLAHLSNPNPELPGQHARPDDEHHG